MEYFYHKQYVFEKIDVCMLIRTLYNVYYQSIAQCSINTRILNVPIILKGTFLSLDESILSDIWSMMNDSCHMAILCLVCSSVFASTQYEPKTDFQKKIMIETRAIFCS